MPQDTSLQSLFDHAKSLGSGGDFPTLPVVYATLVQHHANLGAAKSPESADSVLYSNGPLTISHDQKRLYGEFKRWKNIHVLENIGGGGPSVMTQVFADTGTRSTVAITVYDTGQVTYQYKVDGKPVGGLGPVTMNAVYESGHFVEKAGPNLLSLSFTLGTLQKT